MLPIADEVIRRVHELAKHQNQPIIDKGELSVEWRPGLQISQMRNEGEVVAVYDQPGTAGNEISLTEDDSDEKISSTSSESQQYNTHPLEIETEHIENETGQHEQGNNDKNEDLVDQYQEVLNEADDDQPIEEAFVDVHDMK